MPCDAAARSSAPISGQNLTTPEPVQNEIVSITNEVLALAPTEIVDTDPAKIESDYQLAFNLLKQSQFEQAVNAFKTFLANYPTCPPALGSLFATPLTVLLPLPIVQRPG